MSYRNSKVYLQGSGFYKVGKLPSGWKRFKATSKAVSFYNKSLESSITTNALCGRGYNDSALEVLAWEFISVLKNHTDVKTKQFILDERSALRISASGLIDGVNVDMDVVVVKKDRCNFDFILISPVDVNSQAKNDFETFFGAFDY